MTDTLEHLTDTDLSDLLEADYRRQLRWYPKPWRKAHGDALIGTLLDEADDTDRFTMDRGEWRSFATAGLTARLDRIIMRPVRDAAATVLLSASVGVSLVTFVTSSWAPWGTGINDISPAFGPFYDAGPILTALWVIALGSALVDRWWVGRVALLVSILISVFMHQVETHLAPAHPFSLDAGTLTLSALCAFLVVLGTPRTRQPLAAASAGWAGISCIAYAYLLLAGVGPTARPTWILLTDPARTSWAIALALGVAILLALARFWVPAFTILVSVVPVTAALEASLITRGIDFPVASYLPILAPVTAGLVLLLLASRGAFGFRSGSNSDAADSSTPKRRRSAIIVGVLAPLLVLGGTATAFTVSGLNWTNPLGANWSEYWRTATRSLPVSEHPAASLTYQLPSGGSCTIQVGVVDNVGDTTASPAARSARNYLAAESRNGALLKDARISEVIKQNPSAQNRWTNFWGVSIRYGAGTSSYNPDVEYYEAVDAGIRQAVHKQVQQAGESADDVGIDTAQQCSGEQQ